jgi:hypothetical protein
MEDSDLSLRDVPESRAFVREDVRWQISWASVADFTALRTVDGERNDSVMSTPKWQKLEEIEPILLTDEIVENTFYKRKDFGQDAIFPDSKHTTDLVIH